VNALEIDRTTLTSLRLESGLMPIPERRALHVAQAHERRIDRVARLHTVDDRFGECVEDGHQWPCPTLIALGVTGD
jgi:hypothetical protein